jgi:DNA-binding GntR family transcriptional regulator
MFSSPGDDIPCTIEPMSNASPERPPTPDELRRWTSSTPAPEESAWSDVKLPAYSSKSDMVTAALRELILTGVLRPHTQLRQRELAAQLGVSATPVREALRRLEAEGLLVSSAHRGATVVAGDFGATEENYHIRANLESLAAHIAAGRLNDTDLREIEDLHERFAACDRDDPQHGELNAQFHFRIYQAGRSPLLMTLLRILWQAFPNGPQALRPHEESVAEHRRLVESLRRRDGETAADITREHILGAIPYLSPGSAG